MRLAGIADFRAASAGFDWDAGWVGASDGLGVFMLASSGLA